MCGRYASTRSAADLSALFEAVDETGGGLAPDYNVAPTDPVALVRHSERADGRVLSLARWGLVPSWAKDAKGGARMINARAETVATSRAFGPSLRRRRCLVPADGWYEWVKRPDGKQPYFMTDPAGGPLAFAGLWAVWGSGDQRLLSSSVITVAALGEFAAVHDRMPLVLPPERWSEWLAGEDPTACLAPDAEWLTRLEIRPVGSAVGDVRNDGPELVRAVPAPAPGTSAAVHQSPSLF